MRQILIQVCQITLFSKNDVITGKKCNLINNFHQLFWYILALKSYFASIKTTCIQFALGRNVGIHIFIVTNLVPVLRYELSRLTKRYEDDNTNKASFCGKF